MEQLIELLQQIQELAGVGIDALNEATAGGDGGEGEGVPTAPSGPPPEVVAPAEEPPAE